ncbi:MAG: glycosyltransferase [Pirellulales bacterium]|nr:glycosyltransferase [Pirellulales bacterium]
MCPPDSPTLSTSRSPARAACDKTTSSAADSEVLSLARRPFRVIRFRSPGVVRPELAILVSTYQKPWHLARALWSIACQQGVDGRFEVVVTDDGSTDETPQVVERFARSVSFPVALTTHPHTAFQLARCRNDGAALSTAPYLLFVDGDCVLPPDHLLQHLARRKPGHASCGYCVRLDETTSRRFSEEAIRSAEFLNWAPASEIRALRRRDRKSRFYRLIRHPRKPQLTGGDCGIWRADFERVNGFDENFEGWGGEDTDLGRRLRRAGVRTQSILRWTHTYHLFHSPDASAPARIAQGVNQPYFNRTFVLTRCLNGLNTR